MTGEKARTIFTQHTKTIFIINFIIIIFWPNLYDGTILEWMDGALLKLDKGLLKNIYI